MSIGNVVDLRGHKPTFSRTRRLPFGGGIRPSGPGRVPLRARRRRARYLLAFAACIGVAGMVYGISWLSYLPQVSIASVAVEGASDIAPRLISLYVETKLQNGTRPFISKSNMFFYPRAEIERGIVSFFPRVRFASVRRESFLATALVVNVVERHPYARWCTSTAPVGDCYLMDESGFVFARDSATSSVSQFVFAGGLSATTSPIGKTYLPGHLVGIEVLLQRLGQAGWQADVVTAGPDPDFSIALAHNMSGAGFSLRASFGESVDDLVRDLQLVLSSEQLRSKQGELEYIDLRFGNRVYYKLKGGEPTQSQ